MRFVAALAMAALMLTLTVTAGPARADSWPLPTRETYVATGGGYRLTVTPRNLTGQLGYFEDKVDGREPAGQAPTGPREARGRLERLDAAGRWTVVWDQPLVNDVSPVSALVTPDGAFAVTFDNWHSVGEGENVIVIYDAAGEVVRSLTLTDVVPEGYFNALPHSISSTHWAGEHHFDGDALVLQVLIPMEDRWSEDAPEPAYLEARIDLASGRVDVDPAALQAAMVEADRVNAGIAEAEARWRNYMASPLLAPTSSLDQDWHQYLVETFFRIDPEWDEAYPRTKVLREPGAFGYERSVGWLREALTGDAISYGVVMIGSPSQSNLLQVLAEIVPDMQAGAFEGLRLYVVADAAAWPTVVALFSHTGADLIQLDPFEPVAQRPERMPQ